MKQDLKEELRIPENTTMTLDNRIFTIKGANEMHVYKLKICSGHFPMTASVKGNLFELKNFYGETVPRTTALPEGVNVKVDGKYILIEGADKPARGKPAG